jgi:hypothetical protein
MSTHRIAVIAFVSLVGAASAQAFEPQPAAQIKLRCPDRSPRMSDIELATNLGHYPATQAERKRMLERARNVCAAGLSMVSLIPPTDLRFADDRGLVSDTAH